MGFHGAGQDGATPPEETAGAAEVLQAHESVEHVPKGLNFELGVAVRLEKIEAATKEEHGLGGGLVPGRQVALLDQGPAREVPIPRLGMDAVDAGQQLAPLGETSLVGEQRRQEIGD